MYHIITSMLFLFTRVIDPINCEIQRFKYCDLKKAMEEKIENPLSIVDVREQSEISGTGMIPESINVPRKYVLKLNSP